jgi:hypothetical protein
MCPTFCFELFHTLVSEQIEHFTLLSSILRLTTNCLPFTFRFVHTVTHTVSAIAHTLLRVQKNELRCCFMGRTNLATWSLLSWFVTTRLSNGHVQNMSFLTHLLSCELWRLATLAWCSSAPLRGASLPKPEPNNKAIGKITFNAQNYCPDSLYDQIYHSCKRNTENLQ